MLCFALGFHRKYDKTLSSYGERERGTFLVQRYRRQNLLCACLQNVNGAQDKIATRIKLCHCSLKASNSLTYEEWFFWVFSENMIKHFLYTEREKEALFK